jgi:hypothetical protein
LNLEIWGIVDIRDSLQSLEDFLGGLFEEGKELYWLGPQFGTQHRVEVVKIIQVDTDHELTVNTISHNLITIREHVLNFPFTEEFFKLPNRCRIAKLVLHYRTIDQILV